MIFPPSTKIMLPGKVDGLGMIPINPNPALLLLPRKDAAVVLRNGMSCNAGENGILLVGRPLLGRMAPIQGSPSDEGWIAGRGSWGFTFPATQRIVIQDEYVREVGPACGAVDITRQRIATIVVESTFLKHPAVFEAGAWLKVKQALMDKGLGKHLFSMPLG